MGPPPFFLFGHGCTARFLAGSVLLRPCKQAPRSLGPAYTVQGFSRPWRLLLLLPAKQQLGIVGPGAPAGALAGGSPAASELQRLLLPTSGSSWDQRKGSGERVQANAMLQGQLSLLSAAGHPSGLVMCLGLNISSRWQVSLPVTGCTSAALPFWAVSSLTVACQPFSPCCRPPASATLDSCSCDADSGRRARLRSSSYRGRHSSNRGFKASGSGRRGRSFDRDPKPAAGSRKESAARHRGVRRAPPY